MPNRCQARCDAAVIQPLGAREGVCLASRRAEAGATAIHISRILDLVVNKERVEIAPHLRDTLELARRGAPVVDQQIDLAVGD
eukprot:6173399-Pleurochrysis_carterae.AAC.4